MSMAIIIIASNLTLFVFLKLFPPLLESIQLHGCMTICGTLCIVGTFFIAFVLQETSGQSLDDVGSMETPKTEHIHSAQAEH